MNNFIRHIIIGFFLGSYVSFLFYYLLSPGPGDDFILIFSWGIQGAVFGALYFILNLIIYRIGWLSNINFFWVKHIITGIFASLILGAYISRSIYNLSMNKDGVLIADSFKKMLLSDMIHILLGYAILGLTVGAVISYAAYLKNKIKIE